MTDATRVARRAIQRKIAEAHPDSLDLAVGLAKAVNNLAEQEGRAFVQIQVAQAREGGAVDSQIQALLVGLLTQHTDDTWSGRTNDVRRARFDGIRNEARLTLDRIARGGLV